MLHGEDSEKDKAIPEQSIKSVVVLLFVSIRVNSWLLLLLIRWRFGQCGRQQAFLLFFLIVERESGWRDHARSDEDDEIAFDVLIDVGAKEASNQWDVANYWSFIFGLLHVFAHQSPEHDRLAVPHTNARGYFARAEHRLVDHVLSEKNRHRR